MDFKAIARIRNGFPGKFGIPRQGGIVPHLKGRIVFEREFRSPDAVRGIEAFSHLWLLWAFSASDRGDENAHGWSATVRPPRLGGNRRVGVFATRSPFRPNPIGLTCVRLVRVEPETPDGPVLHVEGADLMDGTPIFDIKPYLPFADCVPDATGGLPHAERGPRLAVEIPGELLARVPEEERPILHAILAEDPRPAYQNEPDRIYGFPYAGMEVRFQVADGVLRVVEISGG